jgi:hypothetical protein
VKRCRFNKPLREFGGLLAFDLKHRRCKPSLADLQQQQQRRRKPLLPDLQQQQQGNMEAMREVQLDIEGNTNPPPLPIGVSDIIWNIWNRSRSLHNSNGQANDHSWIANQIRKLLEAGILRLVPDPDGALSDLGPIYEARAEVTFHTSELPVFLQRDPQNKPRAKVDGAVIYIADPTAVEPHVLIWEVKPAKKDDETVNPSTARIADDQIRHRANSCHLNATMPKSQIILLSVIGRHIRPYLWKARSDELDGGPIVPESGVIRPSNADVPIRISRVSSGPSPSLWRDLCSVDGKRLFQQVIVDMIRITQNLEVQYPEMYGAEGEGPSQAPIIDETTFVSSPEYQPASSVTASNSSGSAGSAESSETSRSSGH